MKSIGVVEMLKVVKLRCEYLENPIGIGEVKPRFGWIIESDGKNILQEAYHVQVAMDDTFTNPLWDTGIVKSSESVLIFNVY